MYYNKSKILNTYKKSEQSYNLEKNSSEIVAALLSELVRSMNIVADKLENIKTLKEKKDIELKNKHFTKALQSIYTLQISLNFEEGKELAVQLFQLYEYCRKQLIKGFTRRAVLNIRRASSAIEDIFIAWNSGLVSKK